MAWSRVDDGFSENPKTLKMKGWDTELGLYMAALCYCARRRDAHISTEALQRVLGSRPEKAARMVELGLWDVNGDGWVIHDWDEYQPRPMTNSERQTEYRRRHPPRNGGVTDA